MRLLRRPARFDESLEAAEESDGLRVLVGEVVLERHASFSRTSWLTAAPSARPAT
jgi:hypothetical protein